jgi:hypothetical protein
MQRLARVGAGREQRVVAEQLGVAVGGALLEPAADLADEAVDVDHQPPVAGPRARLPGPLERLAEQPVELAHVPEGERAQERAKRGRGGNPAPEQPAGATGAQHVTVVDAVRAEHHRVDQRQQLAARVRRPRPVAPQPHQIACQRLDTEPLGERRDDHHASPRDRSLIVELDLQGIQSDQLVILHHRGDLLTQDATAPIGRFSPAQGVILRPRPDGTALAKRWIRAKAEPVTRNATALATKQSHAASRESVPSPGGLKPPPQHPRESATR